MFAGAMLVAMGVDAVFGWPAKIYAAIGHPVTWAGALIRALEAAFNRKADSADRQRLAGLGVAGFVILVAVFLAQVLVWALPGGWIGAILTGVLAWPLVAVQSMRTHVEDVARFGNGLKTPPADNSSPSVLRNVDRNGMMDKTGTTYEALTVLADALQPIRARKNLVLFSPGIYEPGELVRGSVPLNRSRYYEPMIEALNEANVTVYAMNLQADAPSAPVFHQTLESLARETNGDYYRYAVTYTNAIKQVAKASAGYYMLSYRTNKTGRGYQKVAVSVKNHPEFRVAARAGYTYGY